MAQPTGAPTTLPAWLQESARALHVALEMAVRDLTPEQLHHLPGGTANHAAFLLWHHVRTEDNIVRFVLQRRPTVWMEGGWDQRFGLDAKAQGTGWSHEQAVGLRLPSAEAFLEYARPVWRETEAFLGAVPEGELTRVVLVRPLGELPLARLLGTTIVTHGYSHLGELWLLRGLLGLRGTGT